MEPFQSPNAPPEGADSGPSNWWTREAGGREVFKVALPLVISSLSWTVMTFVDRVFLKWESGDAMAAAFCRFDRLVLLLLCLPLGIAMYTSTFCFAVLLVRSGRSAIGLATWQGVWLSLLASPLMLLGIPLAPALFEFADHGTAIAQLEIDYFQILCWGAPAMLMAQALASFYTGRGKTSVVMVVDTIVALINVLLDYLWIFGYWGFPALGIAGAGWGDCGFRCG